MKITIITPTFNSGKFLTDCLQSVANQDYKNIEHIIVDGASTDNTMFIVQSFHASITKYVSEPDHGIYDAINKGISMATGDYVGVLNSDDMLATSDVISSLVKFLEDKNADSIYGDLNFVYRMNIATIYRRWRGSSYNRLRFQYGWMPAHPTFYIKRGIIEKFGSYQTHFYTAADYEFMCRLLYKHKSTSCYMPKVMVTMRMGGQSNGSFKQRLRANRRDYLAMKANGIKLPFFISILKPLTKLNQYNWKKKVVAKFFG